METEPAPANGQKTILVVDDDSYNLQFLSALLVDSHYKVLLAAGAAEAGRQSKEYKNEIHLLLSNFQIAGVSGVELAAKMRGERPQLKVLLMSGFTEGMLVLNAGWHFLPKPHVHSQLRALIAGLTSQDGSSWFSEKTGNSRSAGRRIPTGGKSPRRPASDYRRQSPRAADRLSRGPRESSR